MPTQEGWCVWITGSSGSGKSIQANLLLEKQKATNVHPQPASIYVLKSMINASLMLQCYPY